MGFSIQHNAARGRRRRSSGFTEINVTPLVDVMLVLLVVFMITAPMMTVGVPLDLPKTKAAKLNDQSDPIIVSIDAEGKSFLEQTPLEGEELIGRLRAVTHANPDARIYVRGHSGLSYGRVMEVMGEISAAGFTKVSLLAQLSSSSSKPVSPTSPKTLSAVNNKPITSTPSKDTAKK